MADGARAAGVTCSTAKGWIARGRLIGAADVESVPVRCRKGGRVPQPEEIAAALSRNLRDLRRARQLSLDALAGLAGVSRGMLLQIEGPRVNPSLATLVRSADALDVSVSALVDLGAGASVRLVRAADAVDLWHGEHGGFGRLLVGSDRLDHLETWTWTFEPGEAHGAEAHPPARGKCSMSLPVG